MIPYAASPTVYDALIIGGGPGGLTAAIYLRRFRRSVILIDKGHSRLGWIPRTHNYPGFPDGIAGQALLDNLRRQLERYGGSITQGEVQRLELDGELFVAGYEDGEVRARAVLLATGIADAGMPVERWQEAVGAGTVRLCPVCDGFDVLDKRVAVVTAESNPVGHALFMRSFTADVTLFERTAQPLVDDAQRARLGEAGIRYVTSPLKGVTMGERLRPILNTEDGEHYEFDVLYPMLGEVARSELAVRLGARTAECNELVVDEHQCTTVPGLFAVGDVSQGLNQICVATGEAARAATHIHNILPYHFR
jgi:thioredoxin reductase (NADPH)